MELRDILAVSLIKEQDEQKKENQKASEGGGKDYNTVFYDLLEKYKKKFNVDGLDDMSQKQREEFYQAVDMNWKSEKEKAGNDPDDDSPNDWEI